MNLREIKELLDLVVEKGFTEFELERSGMRLRVRRDIARPAAQLPAHGPVITYEPVLQGAPATAPLPAAANAAPSAPTAPPPAAAVEEDLYLVKSPIVGTFYESPSP